MPGALESAHVSPVIAVTDLERARRFYEDVLGLAGAPSAGGGWTVRGGAGTEITLLAGEPTAGSARWPVATFRVVDVHSCVSALRDAGAQFLGDGELPFDLDDDGVSAQDGLSVAWLRDPDGSILTVYSLEHRPEPRAPTVGMYSFTSADPRRLAEFWARFMHLPLSEAASDDDVVMLDFDHEAGNETWIFQRGDAESSGSFTLDIAQVGSTAQATAAAAERLGATRTAERRVGQTEWVELSDPAGNPFRVFNPFRA
jgi:catechol 2,3-dioxygenase-like lactoylglutathione lyase family enzyme